LGEIDGVKGHDPYLPHLLGHEGCGEVLEVGAGVRTVGVGDRVVLHWRRGTGLESTPAVYDTASTAVNAGWVTTFQDYAVVSENRCTTIPHAVAIACGALLGCAVTTATGVLENDARLVPGESLVVLGAGGVGLSIVQMAVRLTAHPIVAVDLHANRLALARALGATHTINGSHQDVVATIQSLVGKADVVIDNTGHPTMIEAACAVARKNGRVILVGVPPHASRPCIDTMPLHFGQRLIGSHGGNSQPSEDIPRLVRLISTGLLDLRPLIGAWYPLEQINEAISDMRSGRLAGRAMVQLCTKDLRIESTPAAP
jgi:Zn-dependent alcohol dehydrogenase